MDARHTAHVLATRLRGKHPKVTCPIDTEMEDIKLGRLYRGLKPFRPFLDALVLCVAPETNRDIRLPW